MTPLYSNVVSAGETEIEKALALSRRTPSSCEGPGRSRARRRHFEVTWICTRERSCLRRYWREYLL